MFVFILFSKHKDGRSIHIPPGWHWCLCLTMSTGKFRDLPLVCVTDKQKETDFDLNLPNFKKTHNPQPITGTSIRATPGMSRSFDWQMYLFHSLFNVDSVWGWGTYTLWSAAGSGGSQVRWSLLWDTDYVKQLLRFMNKVRVPHGKYKRN